MPLTIESSQAGDRAVIRLAGTLDAASAESVRQAVDQALAAQPVWLELDVEEVAFMSSAGLRVVIFAKQKQPNVKIAFRKPQAPILDTLKKTGFLDAVYVIGDDGG